MDKAPIPDSLAFREVDPASAGAVFAMTAYFDELDHTFPGGFDPGEGGAGADAKSLGPPTGAFILLTDGEKISGCGGVQHFETDTGEIKRMWLSPDKRGLGLGKLLLAELETHAQRLGYRRVVLDTNSTLTTAISMYESAGYIEIERYNDNPYAQRFFEKQLLVADE